MDVARDEYVADMKALLDALERQGATLRHLVNASLVKEEVAAEKERNAAHLALDEAESALKALGRRVGVTEMLGDFEEDDWDILLDKLRGMASEEEEAE